MCGSSHSSSSTDQQGLNKLAGVTTASAEFKVGDHVTGYEKEDDVVTGTIRVINSRSGMDVQLNLDKPRPNGKTTWWVYYSSLKPASVEASEFKVGDYVTGWDDPDQDDDYGDSYVGEITRLDSKDGQNVELRDKDGDTVWVYYSTLSAAERPNAAPVVVEAGPALVPASPVEVTVPAPVVEAPKWPVSGSVDFNKELFGANTDLSEIKVVAHVPGADYPFVVSFEAYGDVKVGTFDDDGYHFDDSDYNLRNAFELPDVVYIILYRDTDNDDQIGTLEEVFDSEESAKSYHLDGNYSLLGILPVYPKELDAKRLADQAAAAAAAESDDEGDSAGDDVSDVSGGLSEISLYITGHGQARLVPGQQIWAERRGFGRRSGKIVKIRADRNKQILFQPNDGSKRYYALNKNLRMSG